MKFNHRSETKDGNPFYIGDRVSGYGPMACVKGTVIGISINPPEVEVAWDNNALHSPGRAGRWEEVYHVTRIS